MSSPKVFDNLTPFDDSKSRDEVMLIEYDNVLVNTNYCILRHLRSNIDKYKEDVKDGELLEAVTNNTSKHDLYEYGKILTHNECMRLLFKNPKGEAASKILKETNYNLHDYSYFLANGMIKLIESIKIKRIFIAISHFNNSTQTDSILTIFNGAKSIDKLSILDIGPYECMKKTLGYTTIFLSDVEDLLLISKNKKFKFNDVQFILMDKISNKDFRDVEFESPNDPNEKAIFPIPVNDYKYTKELALFQEKNNSKIITMDQYYSEFY